jgi:co-chaperonin GroES (HSP10)
VEVSKYLKAFQKLAEENKDFELTGDCCLVEVIKDDELKTKGGILLAPSTSARQVTGLSADKPTFVRILLVGKGYYDDETLEDRPLDVNPGDICLVGATSIKHFSVFGKLISYGETSLGLISAESVQLRFKGQEGYDRVFDLLNSAIEAEVSRGQSQGANGVPGVA